MSSHSPGEQNFWSVPPEEHAASAVAAASGPDSDDVPAKDDAARKIIHIDMDAFYASVEQRDNPSLRGLPVAVGGTRERGVVAAASYEARRYGVRSAMPSMSARRLCPDLIFVKPRFEVYKAVSRQIRDIFHSYTPLVEPLSLDEAYLDVTTNLKNIGSATEVAQQIRHRIRQDTGLTASAGVSYNKFIAKLASDQRKPDGLFVVTPARGLGFIEGLPVGRFHGIGPVTAAKMNRLGIVTGLDLREQTEAFLTHHFGKAGRYYFGLARAVDHRPVNPNRIRKSVGSETTFFTDLTTPEAVAEGLGPILGTVWEHCTRVGAPGRTITLKVKFSDFRQLTRSRTLPRPVASETELRMIALELVASILPLQRSVRLLGISFSGFDAADPAVDRQLELVL